MVVWTYQASVSNGRVREALVFSYTRGRCDLDVPSLGFNELLVDKHDEDFNPSLPLPGDCSRKPAANGVPIGRIAEA